MTQPDEHLDPLDPRFVDAVLARARRRVDPVEAAPAPPAVEASAPPAVESSPPVDGTTYDNVPYPESPYPDIPYGDTTFDNVPYAGTTSVDTTHDTTSAGTVVEDAAAFDHPPLRDETDDDDDDSDSRRTRNVIEWIAVAVGAVVVAFLIRAFLLQAFYIPSESMEPTLAKDDRILVNKLSYRLHDVNRGDLVVFEKPANEPAGEINDLIKRAIALEGETIELHDDGTITIDGRLLTEPYLREGQPPGPMVMSRDVFIEGACTNPVSETTRCTVAEDHVFVMGDNRDHSHDGRAFGPIDEDLIVGRAFVKVWPLSGIGFL